MGRAEDLFNKIVSDGEPAINEFIESQQSEELFLDFKRSADNGQGKKLHDNDRKNLAKAISGFGNSEGGIIVWGVECSKNPTKGDVACSKVPIENPKRFVSWLQGSVSGCTVPPHSRVQHNAIHLSQNENLGFAVTLIPKSLEAPHQCVKPLQYYIRTGSDFTPTPHSVLSGMFGKRPQADLFNMWDFSEAKLVLGNTSTYATEFSLGITLCSWGPGLAKDIYFNLVFTPPRGPSKVSINLPDQQNWRGQQSYGMMFSLVSVPEFRLAPDMIAHPISINLHLEEPFESDLYYKITYGHSNSPVNRFEFRTLPEELRMHIKNFQQDDQNPNAAHEVISKIMKIDEQKFKK